MTGEVRDPSQHGVSPEPYTRPLAELVEMYMTSLGWVPDPPGPAGALWRRRGVDTAIAVPKHLDTASVEWRGVVERLARHQNQQAAEVAWAIQFQLTDVTWLRASHDQAIAGSIPLVTGASLVKSGYAMLRSAATTSVRPRAHIGGHFSRTADEIVDRARLGHTREGSYMIPLLMPLALAEDVTSDAPPPLDLDFKGPIEPEERRVTRTLAQALTAVSSKIIQPEREPRKQDVNAAVVAGASRELVRALSRVLEDPSVAIIEASFDWAGAVETPGGVSSSIEMPATAAPRLATAAEMLKTSSYSPGEVLTGPIIEIRHEIDAPFGHIGVQTIRKGRQVEVRVRLSMDQLDQAFSWARDGRAVLVDGRVRQTVGQRLLIDQPRRVHPLDESYLSDTG